MQTGRIYNGEYVLESNSVNDEGKISIYGLSNHTRHPEEQVYIELDKNMFAQMAFHFLNDNYGGMIEMHVDDSFWDNEDEPSKS